MESQSLMDDVVALRQRALLMDYLTPLTSGTAASRLVEAVPMVVGFVGAIGSGKSTCANTLVDSFAFERMSFAAALKESVFKTLLPLPGIEWRHFYGTQADKAEPIAALGGACGRTALEKIGTEGYRAVYGDVWVDLAMRMRVPGVRYVVDDVRYPNEAVAIRKAGGMLIRVECSDSPNTVRTGHASDTAWEKIEPDRVIRVSFGDLGMLEMETRRAVCRRALD